MATIFESSRDLSEPNISEDVRSQTRAPIDNGSETVMSAVLDELLSVSFTRLSISRAKCSMYLCLKTPRYAGPPLPIVTGIMIAIVFHILV